MTNDDALVERIARIIDPNSWAVMDSYLAETKRKYRGQNVGWPADQFHHKESMAKARAVLAAVTPQIEARVVGEIAKRFDHIRSDLNNISRAIEDEGDRAYFGSTNDADELRQIAQKFEDWLLARERGDYKESQP